jgi:ABC-type lipoprotein release transport system permease subunit
MATGSLGYALRSVRRNARRTILSVVGIAIGCALMLVVECVNKGRDELFARAGAESGTGHLRVVPRGWAAKREDRLRLAEGDRALRTARDLPGVAVAVPRVRAQALLAMGTHVVPVELTGVAPVEEQRAYRYARRVTRGRWLAPGAPAELVIGRAVADRLGADLGDALLATAVGRGGRVESAMFTVVGIVATGSEDVDLSVAAAPLDDVAGMTGLAGIGEVTVLLADWRTFDAARAALAARLGGPDEVLTWRDLVPEFAGHMEQDKASARFVTSIVLLVVVIGVASAQLASVLERRREFAVLAALGMGAGRLVRVVLTEGALVGLAGGLAGLALGGPLAWLIATRGLDFTRLMGEAWSLSGTVIDPVIYGTFGPWILRETFGVAVGATVLASLYPAWFAARTDPAQALRVAQ